MVLNEIKNLKITIKIPEINSTLEELGYDSEYIQTQFLCDEYTDEDDIKEAIKTDIINYLYEFIEPEIIINGHISI
jgi:hypothetical protein